MRREPIAPRKGDARIVRRNRPGKFSKVEVVDVSGVRSPPTGAPGSKRAAKIA